MRSAFFRRTCKILDSKDLLDSRCLHGPQNLGTKALTRKIFRLKDLAAADSARLRTKSCVWRSTRDFSDHPRQNIDFKELIWCRSPVILAKT
jgi:hypothetical protein